MLSAKSSASPTLPIILSNNFFFGYNQRSYFQFRPHKSNDQPTILLWVSTLQIQRAWSMYFSEWILIQRGFPLYSPQFSHSLQSFPAFSPISQWILFIDTFHWRTSNNFFCVIYWFKFDRHLCPVIRYLWFPDLRVCSDNHSHCISCIQKGNCSSEKVCCAQYISLSNDENSDILTSPQQNVWLWIVGDVVNAEQDGIALADIAPYQVKSQWVEIFPPGWQYLDIKCKEKASSSHRYVITCATPCNPNVAAIADGQRRWVASASWWSLTICMKTKRNSVHSLTQS